MALSASVSLTAGGLLTTTYGAGQPVDQINLGQDSFPPAGFTLADGNSNLQAQDWYHTLVSLGTGSTTPIDLKGSALNPFGATINFVKVKLIIVSITAPDGVKKLRVGPQNVANAAQLGFGGVGAQAYIETDTFCVLPSPYGGWAVTAGTADILPINNPSAVTVQFAAWVLGTNT
jgi:hypothetical protein